MASGTYGPTAQSNGATLAIPASAYNIRISIGGARGGSGGSDNNGSGGGGGMEDLELFRYQTSLQ